MVVISRWSRVGIKECSILFAERIMFSTVDLPQPFSPIKILIPGVNSIPFSNLFLRASTCLLRDHSVRKLKACLGVSIKRTLFIITKLLENKNIIRHTYLNPTHQTLYQLQPNLRCAHLCILHRE